MDIYLTQNSYYFVHRHFLRHFERSGSEVIYVNEKGRGLRKKYLEIISNFGVLNFLISSFLEVLYFLKLANRQANLKTYNVPDHKLNTFLEPMIATEKYTRIISIGCPCKIDASFQTRFGIEIINLHGGLIPFQKGRFSPLKSILKGHKHLGATLYQISDVFDEGLILSQDSFKIRSTKILENYNRVLTTSALLLDDFFQKKVKVISLEALEALQKK